MAEQTKMKFLVVTRVFSGLKGSVDSRQWQPKGITTICKLIEGLDRRENIELDVVFACKKEAESKGISRIEHFTFPTLNADFSVLPFKSYRFLKYFEKGGLSLFINQFFHFGYLVYVILKNDYDLIYCDRMHVVLAGFCASMLRKKVALRLLGAYPDMKRLAEAKDNNIRQWFLRKSYQAPFSFIPCTQDGSGGEYFISKAARPDVPFEMLLNGVDIPTIPANEIQLLRKTHHIQQDVPIMLFVGKLIREKGCLEFVHSLIKLSKMNAKFYAFLVGDGDLRESLEEEIKQAQLQNRVFFTGLIDHNQVHRYFALADIYVSTNYLAGLTNTILEAMRHHKCIVRLAASKEEHVDLYTSDILPEGYTILVDRKKVVDELPHILYDLLDNPARIREYSSNMKRLSEKVLWTWDERVEYEINKLIEIARDEH